MTIDGITLACEAITLFATLWGVRRMVRSSMESRKYTPRQMRLIRICRFGTYGVGCVIILFGVYLALTKAMHIRSMESTSATITAVQESSKSYAPYSFYVNYNAGGRSQRGFLRTWTPFSKNRGDTITVLYDPTGQSPPEALLFDSDWLAYLILFAAGTLVIAFSAWMYRWR